jgi:hypothetical protein
MKKVLSVLCMALLAGGMIFTSCTKNFTITVNSNNADWGTVTGGGEYADQATAVLTATPNEGYMFVKWQDGNTENPRTITVTANETYTAEFAAIPVVPGVKVTFNTTNWEAGDIQAKYYTDDQVWDVYSMQTSGSLPIADVATGLLSGSATGAAGSNGGLDNDKLYWIEYYNETYLQDQSTGYYYGDFWAKNATVAVSAFDATALTLSAAVNATMFSAYEAFIDQTGVDAASTAPMVVKMVQVDLAAAKGMPSKKVVGKLVAVK